MIKILLIQAEEILSKLKGKWMYIKFIFENWIKEENYQNSIYSKFKVNYIYINDYYILI